MLKVYPPGNKHIPFKKVLLKMTFLFPFGGICHFWMPGSFADFLGAHKLRHHHRNGLNVQGRSILLVGAQTLALAELLKTNPMEINNYCHNILGKTSKLFNSKSP